MCAIELQTKSSKACTECQQEIWMFIKNLDDALKHLHKTLVEFLICGDIKTISDWWGGGLINNIQYAAHC
jgi:hypothetical protein